MAINPTDRISAGLNLREGVGSPPPGTRRNPGLARVKAIPPREIAQASVDLSNLVFRLQDRVEATNARLRDSEARIRREAAEWRQPEEAIRMRVSEEAYKIRQSMRPEMERLLVEADVLRTKIDDQRPYWTSKAAHLNKFGLGTEKRANYERTAAGAGPAQLRMMANQALDWEDPVLAAVVVTECSARRQRGEDAGVQPQELTRAFPSPDWDQVSRAMSVVGPRFQAVASIQNAFFRGSEKDLVRALSLTFERRDGGATAEEPDGDLPDPSDASDKVMAHPPSEKE